MKAKSAKPNLFAIAAMVGAILLLDAAINARSPIDTIKAILQGKPLPAKGSGKGGSQTTGNNGGKIQSV